MGTDMLVYTSLGNISYKIYDPREYKKLRNFDDNESLTFTNVVFSVQRGKGNIPLATCPPPQEISLIM